MKAKAKNGKMVTVQDLGRAKTRSIYSNVKYVSTTMSTGQKLEMSGETIANLHRKTMGV